MKTIVTLEEGNLPLVECEINGTTRKFNTTLSAILDAISDSFVTLELKHEEPKPIILEPSPSFPMNTVKYGKIGDDGHFLVLNVPASQHDVSYHGTHFKNVGFPNMLFVFKITSKSITSKSIFCYKEKFVRDDTILFDFPYANVFDSGQLCFYPGNYIVEDLVQLQTFPHLWFSTPMNDHLFNPKRNSEQLALRALLQRFENKPFDHDLLCSQSTIVANLHRH